MARQPKLCKKKVGKSVSWFTRAGGSETPFGNVEDISHDEARKAFAAHLHKVTEERPDSKRGKLSTGELRDLFLDRFQTHRPKSSDDTRKLYCSRLAAHEVGSRKVLLSHTPTCP